MILLEYVTMAIMLIIVAIVFVFRKEFYRPDPARFGKRSQDIFTDCTNKTKLCSDPGARIKTNFCIPNEKTGFGCYDQDTGTQSFKSTIESDIQCTVRCVESQFTVREFGECLSYTNADAVVLENYQVLPGQTPAPVPQPRLAADCFERFPNTFQRVERICTSTNDPDGFINNCTVTDNTTGQEVLLKVGDEFTSFEPCPNIEFTQCGSWDSCGTSTLLIPYLALESEQAGNLFAETAFVASITCAPVGIECTEANTVPVDDPTAGPDKCLVFDPQVNKSSTCNTDIYSLEAGDSVCNPRENQEIQSFLIDPVVANRRAITTADVPETGPFIIGTQDISCTSVNGANPQCNDYGRIGLDVVNYGDIRNMVKNRGFVLVRVENSEILSVISQGQYSESTETGIPLSDLTLANSTIFDFIEFSPVNVRTPTMGCTAADIMSVDAIVFSLIPLAGSITNVATGRFSGQFGIACIIKSNILCWLTTGTTLQALLATQARNMTYLDAEALIGTDEFKAKVKIIEDNYASIEASVIPGNTYIVPARNSLPRISELLSQAQFEINRFTVEFSISDDDSFSRGLTEIITKGTEQLSQRVYVVNKITNLAGVTVLDGSSGDWFMPMSVTFDSWDDGSSGSSIRSIFIDRASSSTLSASICTS